MRDTDHPDGRPIPKLCPIEFGHRNVETRSQSVFQTAYNLAPIFDRLCRFDVKFESKKGNRHKGLMASDQKKTDHYSLTTDHWNYAITSAATRVVVKASITSRTLMSP